MQTKICKVCQEEKPATKEYFHAAKECTYGLRNECKTCRSVQRSADSALPENKIKNRSVRQARKHKEAIYGAEYRAKNREDRSRKAKIYYEKNREEMLAKGKIRRDKNKESASIYYKERRKKYREAILAREAAYRDSRKQQIAESAKKWYASNPEMVRLCKLKRRAREKACGGTISKGITIFLMTSQCGLCVYCKVDITQKYHIDHIMPLALGGANNDDNIQLLCPSCNLRKNAKHPDIFMREIGLI